MINLLPSQEKKELEIKRTIKVIAILGSLFLIFLIFLGLLLFSIKIYILSQIRDQKTLIEIESRSTESPEIQELEKNIGEANQIISQFNSFYQGQRSISEILEKISGLLPAETYLTDFFYQKEKSQIILQGYAKNRDNLLEFKKSLENQKEVQNLYSPISNLIKSKDIDFYLSFNWSQER